MIYPLLGRWLILSFTLHPSTLTSSSSSFALSLSRCDRLKLHHSYWKHTKRKRSEGVGHLIRGSRSKKLVLVLLHNKDHCWLASSNQKEQIIHMNFRASGAGLVTDYASDSKPENSESSEKTDSSRSVRVLEAVNWEANRKGHDATHCANILQMDQSNGYFW